MEDCKICYSKESDKKLPCSHEICSSCCVRLNAAQCPFCRKNFIFTADEIKQRIQLGLINGYKWEVPPGLDIPLSNPSSFILSQRDFILPRDWLNNSRRIIIDEEPQINGPFSRAKKSGERRRRRFLSLDEVLERRKELKERKARHWDQKNGRLDKIIRSETSGSFEIE